MLTKILSWRTDSKTTILNNRRKVRLMWSSQEKIKMAAMYILCIIRKAVQFCMVRRSAFFISARLILKKHYTYKITSRILQGAPSPTTPIPFYFWDIFFWNWNLEKWIPQELPHCFKNRKIYHSSKYNPTDWYFEGWCGYIFLGIDKIWVEISPPTSLLKSLLRTCLILLFYNLPWQHRRFEAPEQRPDTYPPGQDRWSYWQAPPVLRHGASLPVKKES